MIDKVVGIGGIGYGVIFKLLGNHDLGREESRGAVLLDSEDYCKGHIILHYAAQFSGVPCALWGHVGADAAGDRLLEKMRDAAIGTDLIGRSPRPTMYTVSYQFPDQCGGNITAVNNACADTDIVYLRDCLSRCPPDPQTMVVCAPEVPLEARLYLLAEARNTGAFTVATALSGEIREFAESGGIECCDLFAVNRDEALSVADTVETCFQRLRERNGALRLIVTDGPEGAYLFDRQRRHYIPAAGAKIVSTAGAGDAFLAGTMIGLIKNRDLYQSALLGSRLASVAIASKDTICSTRELRRQRAFILGE